MIPPGSVLVVGRSGILKRLLPVSINEVECTVNQDIKVIVPFLDSLAVYLRLMLKGHEPVILKELVKGGMTVQSLKYAELEQHPFPFPPEQEQSRIVTKVGQLMALCDELEAKQNQRAATHTHLIRAAHQPLTQPRDHTEFQTAWRRIRDNFNGLHTTVESVKALRQTILQLAVQGKLVPQDPNDEPASVLLEKISAEKERLIAEGKIKKTKRLPIDPEEVPFEVPLDWAFSILDDIVIITGGVTKGRKLAGRELVSVPYLRVANVQRGYLNLDEMKEIDIPEDELEKYTVIERDLLITEGGDWDKVGRTAIWRGALPLVAHQNHVFKARCVLAEQNEAWLEKYLNSAIAREYFAGSSKQTTNLASINMTQLRGCVVPVPPQIEQRRIVAKVKQLMNICDKLEAKIEANQTEAQRFAEAVEAELAA